MESSLNWTFCRVPRGSDLERFHCTKLISQTYQQSLPISIDLDNLVAYWFILIDSHQVPGIVGKDRQRQIPLYKDSDSGCVKVSAGVSIVVHCQSTL